MTSPLASLLRHLPRPLEQSAPLPQTVLDVWLDKIGSPDEGRESHLLLRLAASLFQWPTRPSRQVAEELGISRDHLISLYRLIRGNQPIQELLTYESPMRRRISFLRRELMADNLATLYAMFRGEEWLPNHVEFHPALMCNLRCRACPNCQADQDGNWTFLGYPQLGEPLDAHRLEMIADLFVDLGIRDFSFGGGGEPTLSPDTLGTIRHLRQSAEGLEISLYTNGIFPPSWSQEEFAALAGSLDKIRFSIDAANAREWSNYKGRPAEFFTTLWENIRGVVAARPPAGRRIRLGASCLVSDLTCRDVGEFLLQARDTGLDFCDIKAVETCFAEKVEYAIRNQQIQASFSELMDRIRQGFYAPMDVVVDDSLLRDEEEQARFDVPASRCWVAMRGRMLTVGPYGELYPCSDAANPGAKERHDNKLLGRLTAFSSPAELRSEFKRLWAASLTCRQGLSRESCSYCVPSHNNYNTAVDKLYQDWQFGVLPEEQPFAGQPDHYLASRGA